MDPVTPFDWQRLFIGQEPPLFFLEIVLRVILIYSFTVIMLRYMGKRGQRQMTTFELVLVIALGSATGDSMFYPEVPILYAWLIILLMVGLNRLLEGLQFRHRWLNAFLEGKPQLMIRDGKVIEESLKKENLRRTELTALLREQGIKNTGEVQYAFLEPTGQIGLFQYPEDEQVEGESTFPENLETKLPT
jgi:uncharacterized membrane protein YcaP (DUF421 family)